MTTEQTKSKSFFSSVMPMGDVLKVLGLVVVAASAVIWLQASTAGAIEQATKNEEAIEQLQEVKVDRKEMELVIGQMTKTNEQLEEAIRLMNVIVKDYGERIIRIETKIDERHPQ